MMRCRQLKFVLLAALAGAFAMGARADAPSVGVLSFNMRNAAGAGGSDALETTASRQGAAGDTDPCLETGAQRGERAIPDL